MVAYIDPDFCWGKGSERSKREGGRKRRQRSNVGRGREKKRKREMKLNGELKSSDDGRDGKRSRQQSLAWRTFLVVPEAAISGAPLDSDNVQAAGCWQLKTPLHTVTVADVTVTARPRQGRTQEPLLNQEDPVGAAGPASLERHCAHPGAGSAMPSLSSKFSPPD